MHLGPFSVAVAFWLFIAVAAVAGIIGQFELIYRTTRFAVTKETVLDLPAQVAAAR